MTENGSGSSSPAVFPRVESSFTHPFLLGDFARIWLSVVVIVMLRSPIVLKIWADLKTIRPLCLIRPECRPTRKHARRIVQRTRFD
jgi:hypothetical protein